MSKIRIAKDAVEKAIIAETTRTESLAGQATKVAAAAIVVVGFQLMDTKTPLESPASWVKISCYASLAALAVSLLFSFFALVSKNHSDYPRGNKLWETLKPDSVTEDADDEAVVQLLLKSREQNAVANDAKQRSAYRSAGLLLAGILLVAASQLLDAYLDTLP